MFNEGNGFNSNYSDERRVWMLDVLYFLIDKYDYTPIQVANEAGDLWLLNKQASKYPIIRLTLDRTNKSVLEKDLIIQQADFIGNIINLDSKVLSIHFGEQDQPTVQDADFEQAIMNDNYVSPILTDAFNGVDSAIKFVSDPINDLKQRQMKLKSMAPKQPQKRSPWSLKGITGANIIAIICLIFFILTTILTARYGRGSALIMSGAVYKPFIYGANEWWRLITAGFVHDGFFHIFMNMIVLMQTGLLVERVFSKKKFFIIFLTAVITSSLFALIMGGGSTVTMGASGGIYGLFGAVLVYLVSSKLIMVPMIRRQVLQVFFANLFLSFLPGISLYGHLGGFIGGVLASIMFVESSRFRDIKKHAVIALTILVVGMFGLGIMKDNKVYDVNKSLDYSVVLSVRKVGLEKYSDYLVKSLNTYYGKLGV